MKTHPVLRGSVHVRDVSLFKPMRFSSIDGVANKDVVLEAAAARQRSNSPPGATPAGTEAFVEDGYSDGRFTGHGIATTRCRASPSPDRNVPAAAVQRQETSSNCDHRQRAERQLHDQRADRPYAQIGLLVLRRRRRPPSFTIKLHYQDGTTATDWWRPTIGTSRQPRQLRDGDRLDGSRQRSTAAPSRIRTNLRPLRIVFHNVDSNRVLDT